MDPQPNLRETKATRPRPLSPNIQIYRPHLTSVLSIANRSTGVVAPGRCGAAWAIAGWETPPVPLRHLAILLDFVVTKLELSRYETRIILLHIPAPA